jgi:hypothetical protein
MSIRRIVVVLGCVHRFWFFVPFEDIIIPLDHFLSLKSDRSNQDMVVIAGYAMKLDGHVASVGCQLFRWSSIYSNDRYVHVG